MRTKEFLKLFRVKIEKKVSRAKKNEIPMFEVSIWVQKIFFFLEKIHARALEGVFFPWSIKICANESYLCRLVRNRIGKQVSEVLSTNDIFILFLQLHDGVAHKEVAESKFDLGHFQSLITYVLGRILRCVFSTCRYLI